MGIVVNPTPSSLFVIGRIIISCDSSIARLVLSVSFVTVVGVSYLSLSQSMTSLVTMAPATAPTSFPMESDVSFDKL